MNSRILFFRRPSTLLIAGGFLAVLLAVFFIIPRVKDREPSRLEGLSPQPAVAKPASPSRTARDWPAHVIKSSPSQFPALARQIAAEPPSPARDTALAALLSQWILRSPQGLRAFLDTLGLAEGDESAAQFFAALPGALPLVDERVASSPYLRELVVQLVEAGAASDPRRALRWADAWLMDEPLDQARATIAGVLARNSPEEALLQLDKIRNPLRRIEALSAIGEGYALADPKAAITWAENLAHDTEKMTAMNGVLSVMAQTDPASASAVFQTMQAAVAGRYQALVARDRRMRGLPEKPVLDEQGNEIVADAGGETAMPSENPDFNLLADAAATIAHEMAGSDPAAALRWADSLPGVLRNDGKRAALVAWAEDQPAEAFRYCEVNQWADVDAYGDIFNAWADSDAPAAALAAGRIDGDRLRQAAVANVALGWASSSGDLDAVTQWVNQLPRPADRDAANRALVELTDAEQPRTAWDRALQIANPDSRRTALASAFAGLVAQEPSGAGEALSRAGNLTAAERTSLARMLDGRSVAR